MAILNNPSVELLYRDISGSRKQLDSIHQLDQCRPLRSAAQLSIEDHKQFTIYTLIGITNDFSMGTRRNDLLTPVLPKLCLLVYFSVF